ncbi:MAG: RNA polymerase sigma factor [Pseudomonadales bacterium]
MTQISTINVLVAKIALRDRASFKALYDISNAKLYALVLKMTGDPDLACDILQEAYTKVWLNAHKHNATLGEAWPWLCQVFRNTALDRLRQCSRQPGQIDPATWERLEQASQVEPRCDIDLKACIAQLKPEPRQALMYAYLYGYSHRELAELFQQPLGTLKSWIRRAMQELKLCLSN